MKVAYRLGALRAACLSAAALWLAAGGAQAQGKWPSQPIKFVVAVGAGGAADTSARRVAERLSQALGQPVIVENMPGGSGVLAAQNVARSRPDGYTILIGTNTTHAGNQSLLKNIPYDPVNDFAPISRIGLAGLLLGVAKNLPVNSVPELVAYLKANPNKVNYGSGTGSARFATEMFMDKTGTEMVHVPYRGNNAALTDLLAGNVSILLGDTTLMLPQVQSGGIKGFAVSSAERSKLAPELPTIAETGVKGYELVGWIAAFAPAKTPPEIVERLNGEINRILKDQSFADNLSAIGIDPAPTTQQGLRDWVVSETAKWAEIAKSANIKPE